MGGRSGGVKGADHPGAAESGPWQQPVFRGGVGARSACPAGPYALPRVGREGCLSIMLWVQLCGLDIDPGWPGSTRALGVTPSAPAPPSSWGRPTGPVVPAGLASLSLGAWKDKGCSFFLFSLSGAYGTAIHSDAQNQRPGLTCTPLLHRTRLELSFSKHLPALGNSAPLSAPLTIS